MGHSCIFFTYLDITNLSNKHYQLFFRILFEVLWVCQQAVVCMKDSQASTGRESVITFSTWFLTLPFDSGSRSSWHVSTNKCPIILVMGSIYTFICAAHVSTVALESKQPRPNRKCNPILLSHYIAPEHSVSNNKGMHWQVLNKLCMFLSVAWNHYSNGLDH